MPSTNNQEDIDIAQAANARNADGGDRKVRIRKRRYHPTTYGRLCVNAMTGIAYPWQSGSFEEMRLYKVVDATAFHTKEGFLRERKDPIHKEPNFLYYDSPEQYGRHMRVDVDPAFCAKWHARVSRYFPNGGEFRRDEYEADQANGDSLRAPPVARDNDSVESSDEW